MKVITNHAPARCDKCAWAGIVGDLDIAVALQTRLDEGEEYSPFQCPRCASLVYTFTQHKKSGKYRPGKRRP